MAQISRPSYFPKTTIVPPGLSEEDKHWSIDPELMLTDEAARELARSRQLLERLLDSSVLESMGLSSKLSGVETLKGHGTRVAVFSLLTNKRLEDEGSPLAADNRILATAAMLHDIGKLEPTIHDIVMYPGKIARDDPVAWTIIKRHPAVGHEVAMAMPGVDPEERYRIAEAIYQHHERQDGGGYYNIPISEVSNEAQIIAVTDAADVMMGTRPYKKPFSAERMIAELNRCPDQFSQEVASSFKSLRPSSGNYLSHKAA